MLFFSLLVVVSDGDDLSDSDQTESCILNDANNNDLLEYTNDLAAIKMSHKRRISGNDSDSEEAAPNSASFMYSNDVKSQQTAGLDIMNDENNNEKVKTYRSVCFLAFFFAYFYLRRLLIKDIAH